MQRPVGDHLRTIHDLSARVRHQRREIALLRARQKVLSGWRLVPYEPTQEMCDVCWPVRDAEDAALAWSEMLMVAPEPPQLAAAPLGHVSESDDKEQSS